MKPLANIIFSLLVYITCCAYNPSLKSEILWDVYGVPHIYSNSMTGMYYSFGWAQMHNHANLVLRLYGQARGRGAEYWGEKHMPLDKKIHLFNIPELAQKQYASQNPAFKTYVDAFVKGMNAYAAAHPEAIGADYKQVLPITACDVMAHQLRVVFLEFLAADDIGISDRLLRRGSNAYAIGPSRSASRKAMLVANPHLPWSDIYTFFEAHLNGPRFNAYGVTLVGFPVLAIAFNRYLGWTHTVNTIDASDRYELTKHDNGYWLDSTIVAFDQRTVKLKVKSANGDMQEQDIVLKYAKHGPVIGEKSNKAYAIRISGMNDAGLLYQWHQMAASEKRADFEAALQQMQLPMFNVIYADDAGNISYLFAGNIPRRSEGDWYFWHRTISGSQSKYIWSQTHPYSDLPRLLNPATGFIQNANDPPWTCTWPAMLDSVKYSAYISPAGLELRSQRAINMIKDDPQITFDELVNYKLSTRVEAADRFLPDLLIAASQYPDSMAVKAAAVLQKWDRTTDAASRGAVLFVRWLDKLSRPLIRFPWDAARPLQTPAGLNDPKVVVALLIKAATELEQTYGTIDLSWGEVYRFRMNQFDYPANGGPDRYGIFRTIEFVPEKDKKFKAFAGDSYIAIIEFDKQVKAKVLLSYGNASQPGSKHAGDQLLLLSRNELRTAWLTRKEVEKHLEEKDELVFEK
jgi:acyl-homoserine-lactone acylase